MDFRSLIDMVQTINRNKIKHIEVLGNADQKGSLVESFYEGISTGRIISDETAVKYLYGHENKKDAAYQRLKTRLIRQLTTTAFFIDVNQPSFNDRAKAYFACYREFAAAFVLMLRGSHNAGIYLLEQVLQQTIKYEFTELTTEITRNLRAQTARITGDQKQHQHYVALHRHYEEKRRLEMLALDYYEELVDYYLVRRSPNQEVKRLAEQYFSELMPLATKADTSRFYYYTYEIGIIKYFAINDCRSVLLLIDEALPILEDRKNSHRSMVQGILLQKLACLSQLRIFKDDIGKKTAEYCLSLGEGGENNWFRALECYFYYLSYQGKYSEALLIFEKANGHCRFSQLEGNAKDNWLLMGGYLHLLATLGKLDPSDVENVVGPYRHGRLLNKVEIMDKDREGMNIPLILLPVLVGLAKGDFEKSGTSIEALEKYRIRYLNNDMNKRSSIFVKMLIAFTKLPYEKTAAQKIKKELKILESLPPQMAGQYFAIEIIPYEDLWEMLQEVRR